MFNTDGCLYRVKNMRGVIVGILIFSQIIIIVKELKT